MTSVERTKVIPGDKVICVNAESNAYTQGEVYEVYENEHGWKCLRGDDGLEDILSMLISAFKPAREYNYE